MTFEVDGGREVVAVFPGWHHLMKTPVGDDILAYALGQQEPKSPGTGPALLRFFLPHRPDTWRCEMSVDAADPSANPGMEHSIREAAYFEWENDGRPDGRDQEHWFKARDKALRENGAGAAIDAQPRYTRQIDDNQDDMGRDVNVTRDEP